MRRAEAAETAAEADGDEAAATAQAPAPASAVALAAAVAAAAAVQTNGEPLYFPVNDESCERDADAGGGTEHSPTAPVPDKAGRPVDPLYFPVNEAA
jgi:hypothetical protein